MLCLVLSLWSSLFLVSASLSGQEYSEELFMKNLPDGRVMATFDFITTWNSNPVTFAQPSLEYHYGIFPKSLAEIVSHYSVQELHLGLTQGKWRTRMWGYPPSPTPPGAELWVWFLPFTNAEVEWPGLVNAMSGLVCAHLNDIGPSSTFQPRYSFRPQGAVIGNLSSSQLRYAALPRETVCTENFTPWTKLLPCGSSAGLATLFSALKLYNSEYSSLGLHLTPVCQDVLCKRANIQLQQSLTVVFKSSVKNGHAEWSFSSLFSRALTTSCPLASLSRIVLEASVVDGQPAIVTTPSPSSTIEGMGAGNDRVWILYDVENATRHSKLDLSVKSNTEVYRGYCCCRDKFDESSIPVQSTVYTLPLWNDQCIGMPHPPLLTVQRYLRGSGHEWGGLYTEITNHHPISEIKLLYLDMIPWFCRVHIHTLTVENATVLSRYYQPAKDRQRPQMLEMFLHIPPSTSSVISLQFNRAFLKWTEHPPDAHHGFYINSAVVTTVVPECTNCTLTYSHLSRSDTRDVKSGIPLKLHTELLLISLPTPDFSMPYNVICFVCTVIAIGFGSIFNLTTRKLVPASKDDKGLLGQLLSRIRLFFSTRLRRRPGSKDDSVTACKDVVKSPSEITEPKNTPSM